MAGLARPVNIQAGAIRRLDRRGRYSGAELIF
jgi:hypothetical protein